jgi:hypothetical protein
MKLHLAYDTQGRILAAVPRPGPGAGPSLSLPAQAGAEVADFDPPAEFAGKHPREFLHRLRVDIKSKRLVVAPGH